MSHRIRNARGREVDVHFETPHELIVWGERIADELGEQAGFIGAMAVGSCVNFELDWFSDLDMFAFSDGALGAAERLDACCRRLGGRRDEDAESVHFPLDTPGYLFEHHYIEPGILTIAEVDDLVAKVLSAQARDEGRIFALRNGKVLFDKTGEVSTLQERLRSLSVPGAYLKWFASISLDCPMKLLIHAVERRDYPYAAHWLVQFYYDCVRIIFARNKSFFPGMKRTLLRTLPELAHVPAGFCHFWTETFSTGIGNWDAVVERCREFASELKGLSGVRPPRASL